MVLETRGQVFKLDITIDLPPKCSMEIKESGRRNNEARQICLYLLRRLTDMTNEEIAGHFAIGYTAVSQAVSRLKKEMGENKKIKKTVQDIEKELLSEE